MTEVLHLRGVVLPAADADPAEPTDLWTADGRISTRPVAGARTVFDGGWLLPGLVDAHCHLGIASGGLPADLDQARAHAVTDRDAGALLLRDCGSPIDTGPLRDEPDLPRLIRAGRHLARPRRYLRHLGHELEHEELLPDAVAQQALAGDGWVKLVGDWVDREAGDLRPLWSDEVLVRAVDRAHALGARVTAHVFGEDAVPGLLAAGIDCLEHGTGLTDQSVDRMAATGTALVPTLINIETFPAIADSATRFPVYAAHLRALHAGARARVAAAIEAGVPVYAGTDAGGTIGHGRIVDEVAALRAAGMSGAAALAAASWRARAWLGLPGLVDGAPADLVGFRDDPSRDADVLRRPDRIVLRGAVIV